MPDYPMLTELLDLPHVRVTHYQLVGPDRLNLCQHRLRKSADQRIKMSPNHRAKCPLGCATLSLPLWRIRQRGSAT